MNKIKIGISLIVILLINACSSPSQEGAPMLTTADSTAEQTNIENDKLNENGMVFFNDGDEVSVKRYQLRIQPTEITLANQQQLPIAASTLSAQLSHEIATILNETHRFDIIPIQNQQPANNENSENSVNGSKETDNTIQLAQQNTVYDLTITIHQLDIEQAVRILKATGQGVDEKRVSIALRYQITNMDNHKVVFSRSLHYQLKSTIGHETLTTVIENTLNHVAGLIKDEIMSEISPVRILSTTDGQIVLDHPLSVGTQCEVVQTGPQMSDAYRNNLLGYEQRNIGKIRITQTTSVVSLGELMTGEAQKGNLCKPIKADTIAAPELIKRTAQGGVLLPFD